jgi:hypothetical protein
LARLDFKTIALKSRFFGSGFFVGSFAVAYCALFFLFARLLCLLETRNLII